MRDSLVYCGLSTAAAIYTQGLHIMFFLQFKREEILSFFLTQKIFHRIFNRIESNQKTFNRKCLSYIQQQQQQLQQQQQQQQQHSSLFNPSVHQFIKIYLDNRSKMVVFSRPQNPLSMLLSCGTNYWVLASNQAVEARYIL